MEWNEKEANDDMLLQARQREMSVKAHHTLDKKRRELEAAEYDHIDTMNFIRAIAFNMIMFVVFISVLFLLINWSY